MYDKRKFKELVLHIANQSVDDPHFGATKLNKLLFFSDFLAHANLGEAITGAEYQKLEHGPAPRQMKPVETELIREGSATVLPKPVGKFTQRRLAALRPPVLSFFSADEIALVAEVIDMLRDDNAVSVSELSHRWSLGWRAASDFETIPYGTVVWSSPEPGSDAMQRAEDLARRLGLVGTA